MKFEKTKEALSKFFDASNRIRWGILAAITIIFTLLLYPNLVITKHRYDIGDVAEGSRVDTIWEATIGNMGRVIYVFEVQTKGSIDSLILNLLKALNNPAVQGVVAVSDAHQLEKIKRHANGVTDLRDKLKYLDYVEVLRIHENLEYVNATINELGLVPEGF